MNSSKLLEELFKSITVNNLVACGSASIGAEETDATTGKVLSYNAKVYGVSDIVNSSNKSTFTIDVLTEENGKIYTSRLNVITELHADPNQCYHDYIAGNAKVKLVSKQEMLISDQYNIVLPPEENFNPQDHFNI